MRRNGIGLCSLQMIDARTSRPKAIDLQASYRYPPAVSAISPATLDEYARRCNIRNTLALRYPRDLQRFIDTTKVHDPYRVGHACSLLETALIPPNRCNATFALHRRPGAIKLRRQVPVQ